jgi:hypothetical protein
MNMQAYRMLGAALGWFALLTQYGINVSQIGLVEGSVYYFGFFTILGNILVAAAFGVVVLPDCGVRRFFERAGVRTAIAVYILVIAVIFYVLLRKVYHPTGLGYYINILLHYVMPPLFILDWILFVDKRELRFRQMVYWAIFPLAYAMYVLAHGAASGYYPYPFLDVGQFGYAVVCRNILGLTAVFLVLDAGFIAMGRYLK